MKTKLKIQRRFLFLLTVVGLIALFLLLYLALGDKNNKTKNVKDLSSKGKTNYSESFVGHFSNNSKMKNEIKSKESDRVQKNEPQLYDAPKIIDDLARKFTREELILMRECSRANLDLNIVKGFLSKAQHKKNRQELMELARLMGGSQMRLKLELIRYVNKKFPSQGNEKKDTEDLEEKKISPNSILMKMKKQ
jgi:hypothetical protein